MKKKRYLLTILFVVSILNFSLMLAAENSTSVDDKAYKCLEEKIKDQTCEKLSTEEKIFSYFAIKNCKKELIDDSDDSKCWPKSSCNIKSTAQATLALSEANSNTIKSEEWILAKNITTTNLDWFLQIETSQESTCKISYSNSNHEIKIKEYKTIDSNAGNCLTRYNQDYWLKVSPACYNQEFEITCDKGFLSTLLFKKKDSSTIHISSQVSSSSAEGTTTEKINSLCFSATGTCDYEGTLWAALVLKSLDYDVSSYLPYLITGTNENKKTLPEAFLFFLVGGFKQDLLLKQEANQYWSVSGNKFYDTALALYALQYDNPIEKENSINWLTDIQGTGGCWNNGNIRDTAFILSSVWPRSSYISPDEPISTTPDCEDKGNYCMSGINCEEGNILSEYDCAPGFKCCSVPISLESCEAQYGEICNANEECIGGKIGESSDDDYGNCCLEGTCQVPKDKPEESECETYAGTCRPNGCEKGEEKLEKECEFSGESCCFESPKEPGKNLWWIWTLLFLIVLVIAGIIFRNKLRPYWFSLKSKFSKSDGPMNNRGPRGPPGFPPSRMPIRRPIPRRIVPQPQEQGTPKPQRRLSPEKSVKAKPNPELEDVLKKLKEMGQ